MPPGSRSRKSGKKKDVPDAGKSREDGTAPESPEDNKLVQALLVSAFLAIILGGVLFLAILYLSQERGPTSGDRTPLTLAEDEVVAISEQVKEIKRFEEKRREGYGLGEKPFDDRNYAYDERTVDFRLVCADPCPVPRNVLDQEFAAMSYSLSTLRGLTGSDIEKKLMPFEVHASEDSRCRFLAYAAAYKTVFVDDNGHSRGLLCFFYDRISYDRSRFPYSTSVHEVTHLFQDGKIKRNDVIWEGLSEMMESFFVSGNEQDSFCWQGNKQYDKLAGNPHDPHGTGRQMFFELCDRYGFDYDDLPALFRELDERKNVSEEEFVGIVNDIVGKDTSRLFRKAGVI